MRGSPAAARAGREAARQPLRGVGLRHLAADVEVIQTLLGIFCMENHE
jgi:hypothetical protein